MQIQILSIVLYLLLFVVLTQSTPLFGGSHTMKIVKSALLLSFFLLCVIAVAGTDARCLSPSSRWGKENYEACCPAGALHQTSGREYVDGVEFQYTCATWASPPASSSGDSSSSSSSPPPLPAVSARDCAKLCSDDGNCAASTWWSTRQLCFLTGGGAGGQSYGTGQAADYLLLEKTGRTVAEPQIPPPPPPPPLGPAYYHYYCEPQVNAATTRCETEGEEKCNRDMTALEQRMKSHCAYEKAALIQTLEVEKSQIQQDRDTAVNNHSTCQRENTACQSEKTQLAEALYQCRAKVAGLVAANNDCLESQKKCSCAWVNNGQERNIGYTYAKDRMPCTTGCNYYVLDNKPSIMVKNIECPRICAAEPACSGSCFTGQADACCIKEQFRPADLPYVGY